MFRRVALLSRLGSFRATSLNHILAAAPSRGFHATHAPRDLISGALDEALAEEKEEGREDEEDYFEETQGQDFATAYRANAKGSMWRYRRIIDTIRGQPLNDAFETLKTVSMHRKAQVVHKVLWAARAAAEHNYGLDPEKLYVHQIFVTKGVHLTGRAIFHGRGRVGMKTRPRTHLNVVVKEMPDQMQQRVDAWETREALWRDHVLGQVDKFKDLFPEASFALPQNRAEMYPHNAKKVITQNENYPSRPLSDLQAPSY